MAFVSVDGTEAQADHVLSEHAGAVVIIVESGVGHRAIAAAERIGKEEATLGQEGDVHTEAAVAPSLVLIIMADQLGRSVGDMYQGALLPGLVLTCLYVGYVALVAVFKPQYVPALPPEARTLRGAKLFLRVLTTLLPPLLLIFLVLGTIFLGIATPTEGGAMGAFGALVLAVARKRLNVKLLKQAMESTPFPPSPPMSLPCCPHCQPPTARQCKTCSNRFMPVAQSISARWGPARANQSPPKPYS